jgi:hypothetical protein
MRNLSTCVQYTDKRTKNTRAVIQAVLKPFLKKLSSNLPTKVQSRIIRDSAERMSDMIVNTIFPKSILNITFNILPTEVCHFKIG